MMNKRNLFLVGLVLFSVGVLVSCQSPATPTLAELPQAGISVGISDNYCPAVSIKVGQQIGWTNQGKGEHIVRAKSTDGQNAFSSGTLQPGDSFAVSLTQPGVYQYDCSEDGSLTGKITVEP
jgi:plastocyanin